MKSIFSILAVLLFLFNITGCSESAKNDGKLRVAVGLPPIAGLTKIIGGEKVDVIQILPEGKTPHDFTPNTDTIRRTSSAKIFFTTKMPFENRIAQFMRQHGKICDVTVGIPRIAFHDGGNNEHLHHDGCTHDDHDPHVWLSPVNAIDIAENICSELSKIDPNNTEYYHKNLDALKTRLSAMNDRISAKLSPHKGKTFFVYHPAFGYFADAYKLRQRAIELNGREATGTQLAQIIREAKEAKVNVIFVQEQFNPRSAEALSKEIDGKVVPLDPLAENLPDNLEKIADSVCTGFSMEKK